VKVPPLRDGSQASSGSLASHSLAMRDNLSLHARDFAIAFCSTSCWLSPGLARARVSAAPDERVGDPALAGEEDMVGEVDP
jgi:hypothetical protein